MCICVPHLSLVGRSLLPGLFKYTETSSLPGVILAPIGLAADVIIFILPIPIILKSQLAMDKKIGLVVVFLFGLV